MKILVLEDDHIIGPNIKEYLEESGFMVELKTTGASAIKEATKNTYDMFVFDVMLPDIDGFEVTKKLREQGISTPIIFLTAKEDLESKEKGFQIGGDDYLTKPFKLKELVLRVRSILKRTHATAELDKIIIGDISLDLALKEVTRGENIIPLTPKEFMILEYLMKHESKVVPKKEILEYIWGINNDIWSDVIRAHMLTLRKKLNKHNQYDPIKTVRGIGFKFEN